MNPPPVPEALFRAAVQAHREGRVEEAERGYRALAPVYWRARDNLALLLLAEGRLEEGFGLYEGRFTRPERQVQKPRLSFPEWDGGPVKSLLVWPEQGFGDQLLHARWLPWLIARGVRVSVLCLPTLAGLFRSLGAEVIVQAGEVSIPRHDAWAMIGSLPHLCGARLESLPAEPYLFAPPEGIGGGGIGVAWRGDPRYVADASRSLGGESAERLRRLGRSLLPEDTGVKSFIETAQIMMRLDLVISVDTSIANLAGALGRPCWVLLGRPCDWRWMREGEATPWYPTAKLYRQERPGDWAKVLDRVERDLRKR